MHSPARALDVDDDGVMDQPIDDGGGDDGVAEVIPQLLEVDVGRHDRGSLAVAAPGHFEEQGRLPGILLFDAIEAYFIDQEDFRRGVELELLGQGIIGPTGQEGDHHVRRCRVAAAELLCAAEEQERLGEVAFAGARVAGDDQALFAAGKIEFGQFEDLRFVDTGLEIEVEIGQKLSFRQFGLLDPAFDAPVDPLLGLDGQEPFQEFRRR